MFKYDITTKEQRLQVNQLSSTSFDSVQHGTKYEKSCHIIWHRFDIMGLDAMLFMHQTLMHNLF